MTDEQMKTYKTKCEIEYSQEYLPSRDITLIFEVTTVWGKNVKGEPEEYAVRERITGFYHGEPEEYCFKQFYSKGCEGVMDDEMMTALTVTHGERPKDNVADENAPKEEECKYDYTVVVYGGFDETPLVKYQRDYDSKDKALEVYHELEDTFRLEHKIFDNNTEEFIDQKECSAMAVVECGPYDEAEVISFKSLIDKTNLSYDSAYRQIIDYLTEYCNL